MVLKLPKIVLFCKFVLTSARNLNTLKQFISIHLKDLVTPFQKIVFFYRVFADMNKKLQKGYNFWQYKNHKSGRRYDNSTNDATFFICFSSPNCLGTLFLHLKIVKINFDGVTIWSILVCKIPKFWRWKLWG